MQVERTDKEILIRVDANTNLVGLQRLLDFIKFREITSKSKATEEQIENMVAESKMVWWKKNKKHYIK